MKKNVFLIIAAAVLIGALMIFISSNQADKDTTENPQNLTDLEGPQLVSATDGQNTVIVRDQSPGNSINIYFVSLVHSGYIAIHKDDEGSPGEIIGTSSLLIGEQENLKVPLQSEVSPGEDLYAMLHTDNGDGQFEFPGEDVPLQNKDGQHLTVRFSIANSQD